MLIAVTVLLTAIALRLRLPDSVGLWEFPKVFALWLCGATIAFAAAATQRSAVRLAAGDLCLLAYLGWVLLSALLTVRLWTVGVTVLASDCVGVLLYFAAARVAREREGARRLLDAILAVAVIVAAVALVEAIWGWLPWPGTRRPYSTLGGRNPVACYAAIGLAIAAGRGLLAPSLARIVCVILLGTVMVLTRCRGVWLGTTLAAAFVAALVMPRPTGRGSRVPVPGWKAMLMALAVAVVLAVALPWPGLRWKESDPFLSTLRRIGEYDRGSGRARVDQHAIGAAALAAHPLLGVGPGQWGDALSSFAHAAGQHAHPYRPPETPGSDLLRIAVEAGLPAFAFLVAFAAFTGLRGLREVWRTKEPRPSLLASLAALVIGGVYTALDPPLHQPPLLVVLAVLAGIARGEVPQRERAQVLGTGRLGLLALGLLLCASSLLLARAEWLSGQRSIESLREAQRWFPRADVAGRIAFQLSNTEECAEALPEIEQIRAWTPSRWGVLRDHAACLRAAGDAPSAQAWLRQAQAVEPHLAADGLLVTERLFRSPPVINTHAVFAPRCHRIFYSSNEADFVRPFVMNLRDGRARLSRPTLVEDRNLDVRSLSADCRTLALVSDREGAGSFDVFLLDLGSGILQNLTAGSGRDNGDPSFSPAAPLLAYLSAGELRLFDAGTHRPVPLAAQPASFKAVSWSADGARVLLEDVSTNLWELAPASRQFRMLWRAPRLGYNPRTAAEQGGHLVFVSDHESDFSQVYDLDLATRRLIRVHAAAEDQYSPERLTATRYRYRANRDGRFVVVDLESGHETVIGPTNGVVYDASFAFGNPIFVYSDDRSPTSLYKIGDSGVASLVPLDFAVAQTPAVAIRSAAGMANLLYLPAGPPKSWLLWLHGGPAEQVSPRFNLYFDSLLRQGIAIYAVNFPGSAGIGNSYELRGSSETERIAEQMRALDRDLAELVDLHPEARSFAVVGVSYGSILAHRLRARHPQSVTRLVDLSGIATTASLDESPHAGAPVLFLYGDRDPATLLPGRTALIEAYRQQTPVREVRASGEGHFVQRRSNIDCFLDEIERFLAEPQTG